MMAGFPPFFSGDNRDKLMHKICNKDVFFPNEQVHGIKMSEECKDFIAQCLKKDPKERLGSTNGVQEVISHAWFQDQDPKQLLKKQVVIPKDEIPVLSEDPLDLTYFEDESTQTSRADSVLGLKEQRLIIKNNHLFDDFDR